MNRLAALCVLALAALATAAGCGSDELPRRAPSVGPDERWRPRPLSPAVRAARPVARMSCSGAERERFGVHLELFARRRVMIVPAGIGVAPPQRRDGAYVRGGRCSYALRTREPTGVIEVEDRAQHTLGDLFDLWGQQLSPRRIGAFRGRVVAHVGGRPWRHDPRAIPLDRHAQIVLQVQGRVPPHAEYRFPPGL